MLLLLSTFEKIINSIVITALLVMALLYYVLNLGLPRSKEIVVFIKSFRVINIQENLMSFVEANYFDDKGTDKKNTMKLENLFIVLKQKHNLKHKEHVYA